MNNIEKLAIEIQEQCQNSASVSDLMQILEDFAKALQQSSEPVAWMLKTGHGTNIQQIKPDCYIDKWQPLFTHPPVQSSEPVAQPFGYWHQGETYEESEFFLASESGDVSCEHCIKVFTHPPASVPLEKYNKLLDALKEKERFIELAFQAHTNLDLDVQAVTEAEGKS